MLAVTSFLQLGKSCTSMSLSCTKLWLSDGCENDGDYLEFTNFDDMVKSR